MIILLLIVLFIFTTPLVVDAACEGTSPSLVVASPRSASDVNDCFIAAVSGDTITIPAGTYNWAGSGPIGVVGKAIIVTGVASGTEAQCAAGGQTTYTCITSDRPIMNIDTPATGYVAMKNFTMINTGATGCSTYGQATTNITGLSSSIRITGMNVYFNGTCGGLIFNNVLGVVDHNTLFSHNNFSHSIVVRHTAWNAVGAYGDNSWASDSTIGQSGNVFIEDNIFDTDDLSTQNAATDHYYGGRAVMRFNTLTNVQLQNHGTESGGRIRSARHMEVYRNNFTWSTTSTPAVISARGGTAMMFDNALVGPVTRVIDFVTLRAAPWAVGKEQFYAWGTCKRMTVTSVTRSGSTATVTTPSEHGVWATGSHVDISGAGQAEYNLTGVIGTRQTSTTFTYPVTGTPTTPATGTIRMQSTFDTNTDDTGYRCVDQVGAGKGGYVSGDGPGSTTMTPLASLGQAIEPIYCWNNTDDGVLNACQNTTFGTDVAIENREYYNETASFNGTTGMGRGLLSARPATCTTGVAYWVTDQADWDHTNGFTPDGELHACTATNTWGVYYTPYTYPHPLQMFEGNPAPDPPAGGSFLSSQRPAVFSRSASLARPLR